MKEKSWSILLVLLLYHWLKFGWSWTGSENMLTEPVIGLFYNLNTASSMYIYLLWIVTQIVWVRATCEKDAVGFEFVTTAVLYCVWVKWCKSLLHRAWFQTRNLRIVCSDLNGWQNNLVLINLSNEDKISERWRWKERKEKRWMEWKKREEKFAWHKLKQRDTRVRVRMCVIKCVCVWVGTCAVSLCEFVWERVWVCVSVSEHVRVCVCGYACVNVTPPFKSISSKTRLKCSFFRSN